MPKNKNEEDFKNLEASADEDNELQEISLEDLENVTGGAQEERFKRHSVTGPRFRWAGCWPHNRAN